jgi:hypothetical protein
LPKLLLTIKVRDSIMTDLRAAKLCCDVLRGDTTVLLHAQIQVISAQELLENALALLDIYWAETDLPDPDGWQLADLPF